MNEHGSVAPNRAERPLVLALDIGSSSVRAAFHDRLGRALIGCSAQVPYGWDVGPGGAVRILHPVLLTLVGDVLDELARAAGPLADDVVAAGVSCFFHSIVGLDGHGRPVTPVLSWADTTSAGQAAALRETTDAEGIRARTGAPIHASYWPARVLRLRQEQPGVRRWAGFPELLAEAITGRAVVSRSMASGTGLLDRARGTWDEALLEELGIEIGELPLIVADDEPIGHSSGDAARRWPSFARVDWFAPWGDGACGNVGLGALGPGRAALMVGTSGALRATVADAAPPVPAGLFAYRLGAGALVGGQLTEGGGMLAWAGRLFRQSAVSLERAAGRVEPGAHELSVLPYVFSERGLGYHDRARGVLSGITPETDAAAIYRALLDSIAHGFAALDDRLSSVLGGAPKIVAAGGALVHSPLLVQAIADSLGRDIGLAPSIEASRQGAALLALRGAGLLGPNEAIPGPPTRTIRFDEERSGRHREARERQERLYKAILG